jgi:transcriptional regulator with XRE-family HTH domain
MVAYWERVANKIVNSNLTQEYIANQIGVTPGHLTNALKGKYKLDFYPFLKLVRLLFEHDQINELVYSYILDNPKDGKIKAALEYALFNEYYDLLKRIIEFIENGNKKSSALNEWVQVYKVFLDTDDYEEVYRALKGISVKTEELKIFKDIIEIRKMYYSREQNFLIKNIILVEEQLTKIKNSFVRNCYYIRLSILNAYTNLYLNNVEEAINRLNDLLEMDIDQKKKGHIYHALGLCYFKTNPALSFNYLYKSKEIFRDYDDNLEMINVQNTINFISCYSGQLQHFCDLDIENIEHKSNIIFKLIRENKVEEAFDFIQTIVKENKLSLNNEGFINYYLGLITGEQRYFYVSATYFNKCNDKLFCSLPCDELKKEGVDDYILNSIYGDFFY